MKGDLDILVRWGHGNIFRRYDRTRELCGGRVGLCQHCMLDELYRHLIRDQRFGPEVSRSEIEAATGSEALSRPFWYDYSEPLVDPAARRRLEHHRMLQLGIKLGLLPARYAA